MMRISWESESIATNPAVNQGNFRCEQKAVKAKSNGRKSKNGQGGEGNLTWIKIIPSIPSSSKHSYQAFLGFPSWRWDYLITAEVHPMAVEAWTVVLPMCVPRWRHDFWPWLAITSVDPVRDQQYPGSTASNYQILGWTAARSKETWTGNARPW